MVRRCILNLMLAVGLALLCVAGTLQNVAAADAGTETAWMSGAPQVAKLADATIADATAESPMACKKMTLPVVRQFYNNLLTKNEDHCMIRISAGLIDGSLTNNWAVYEPNGFNKAYPLDITMTGKPLLMPVPNYPSAFWLYSDSSYPGLDVVIDRDLSRSLKFNNNLLSPRYVLEPPSSPVVFKYANGHQLAYLPGAFSNTGTYWVAEASYYGFVRLNLTTMQLVTFAPNTMLDSARKPLGAETAVSPSGRYAVVAYNAPGGWGSPYFKIVDVDSCGDAGEAYVAGNSTCQTVNFEAQLKQAIPNLVQAQNIQFATDDSLNFVAVTKNGSTYGYERYSLTAAGQTMRLEQYLAMGDSFAAGEGTFQYIDGTDYGINKCHQSYFSYPYLMAARVGTVASVACSGAVIGNITPMSGQKMNQLDGIEDKDISQQLQDIAKQQHIPGIIAQNSFVAQDNPQVVTVSIGGNDVGFADIIKQCIIPFNNGSSLAQNCYETYEDRMELINLINNRYDGLTQTYKSIKKLDPTRRVYVVGYPQLVEPGGKCGYNVRLSGPDTQFAHDLVDYLDSVIERAAAAAGVQYIDTQHAFDGHKLCESGEKAVNGLTAGDDNATFHIGNESYHPNRLGYQLLADTILAQTHNLTTPMPAAQDVPAPTSSDQEAAALLDAPAMNRTLYEVINGEKDIAEWLLPGITHVDVELLTNTVLPNSTMDAVLHSTPMHVGTLSVNAAGAISGDLQIPAGTEPGFHVLHLYGKNIFGDPIDIQTTVYVGASATDYDGDGIPNASDSCSSLPNSGYDADEDGIDDACDPVIGSAPVTPVTPPAGTNIDTTDQSKDPVVTTSATKEATRAGAVTNNGPANETDTFAVDQASTNFGEILGLQQQTEPGTKQLVIKGSQKQPVHAQNKSLWLLVIATTVVIIVGLYGTAHLVIRRRS